MICDRSIIHLNITKIYPLFLEFLDYIMKDKWIKLVGFSQLTLTDHLYQINLQRQADSTTQILVKLRLTLRIYIYIDQSQGFSLYRALTLASLTLHLSFS